MLAAYVALVAAGAGTAGRGLGRCAAAPLRRWAAAPRSWTLAPPAGGVGVQDRVMGVPPHPPPQRKSVKPAVSAPLAAAGNGTRPPAAENPKVECPLQGGLTSKIRDADLRSAR